MKRKTIPDLRPLTPNFAEYLAVPPLTKSELEALRSENRQLRQEVSYLKKRHEVLENALARQLTELQKALATVNNVFKQMNAPLVALPWSKQ